MESLVNIIKSVADEVTTDGSGRSNLIAFSLALALANAANPSAEDTNSEQRALEVISIVNETTLLNVLKAKNAFNSFSRMIIDFKQSGIGELTNATTFCGLLVNINKYVEESDLEFLESNKDSFIALHNAIYKTLIESKEESPI